MIDLLENQNLDIQNLRDLIFILNIKNIKKTKARVLIFVISKYLEHTSIVQLCSLDGQSFPFYYPYLWHPSYIHNTHISVISFKRIRSSPFQTDIFINYCMTATLNLQIITRAILDRIWDYSLIISIETIFHSLLQI